MIDLDHFKQINDQHGHAMGDAVLCRVSSLLAQHMRTSDLCCRYGGEEFLLFLPDMGLDAVCGGAGAGAGAADRRTAAAAAAG